MGCFFICRYPDNIVSEGAFTGRPIAEVPVGERAEVKRHKDHLTMTGTFEGREEYTAALRGERADIVRRADNLVTEGPFIGKEPQEFVIGERPIPLKHGDNLRMEGQFVGKDIPEAPIAQRVVQKR